MNTQLAERPCPYTGVAYNRVPGYVEGYGCPVCKAIGSFHINVTVDEAERTLILLPKIAELNKALDTKALLMKLGFVYINNFELDPEMYYVWLPKDWKLEKNDDPKHIMILGVDLLGDVNRFSLFDEKGRKRLELVFNTTNISSSRAYISRYFRIVSGTLQSVSHTISGMVLDPSGTEVYSNQVNISNLESVILGSAKVFMKVQRWLDVNFPDWNNAGAYWDSDIQEMLSHIPKEGESDES